MAGKFVLYKLVVLGDGGTGKTALTIQVNIMALLLDLSLSRQAAMVSNIAQH